MGAWCCNSCALQLGLKRGHGYARRGYCGAGEHEVVDRIEWQPDIERGAVKAPPVRPAPEAVARQLDMFGA